MKIENLDTQFKKVQPAVIAFFKNLDHLEKTLGELKSSDFKNEDISILTVKKKDLDTNILEGVATGAITGATGGGLLCWLASLGMIAIPGAGTFIAAGPFISAIAGAALGVNAGCIAGALVGFGVAELEAKELEKYIMDKGLIVAVHVDDPGKQLLAKKILAANEALKIFDPLKKRTVDSKRKHFGPKLTEV